MYNNMMQIYKSIIFESSKKKKELNDKVIGNLNFFTPKDVT